MTVNIGVVEGLLRLRDEFTGRLKKANDEIDQLGAKWKKAGEQMTAIGGKMFVGLTLPIIGTGVAAMKAGADVVESENLFEVSFGRMAKAARAWSEETADALKLNAVELRRSSGVVFVMADAMGIAEQEAFKLATGMTELAGDMSSFFNLPVEEAFTKLRSGIVGETEGLRRLGILVDEATVEQYALAAGIIRAGEEMTAQEKVLARWAAIQAQTTKITGDLARTLDSPSNKLRALGTHIQTVTQRLGVALLPTMERLIEAAEVGVGWLEKLVGVFSNLPPPVQNAVLAFAGILAAIGPILLAVGPLVAGIGSLAVAFPAVASALATFTAAAGTALATLTGPVGWIAAGALLLLAWRPVREFLFDLAGRAISAVVGAVRGLVARVREWWAESEHARRVLAELARIVWRDVSGAVVAAATKVAEFARHVDRLSVGFLEAAGVLPLLRRLLDGTAEDLDTIVEVIGRAVGALRKIPLSTFLAVLTAINPALGAAARQAAEWGLEAGYAAGQTKKFVTAAKDVATTGDDLSDVIDGIKPPGGVLEEWSSEAKQLRGELERVVEQKRALIAATEEGRPAYEALAAQFDAIEKVISAGIDPTSAMGKELVALGEAAGKLDKLLELKVREMELAEQIADLGKAIADLRETRDQVIAAMEAAARPVRVPDWTSGLGGDGEGGEDSLIDVMMRDILPQLERDYKETFGYFEQVHEQYLEGLQRAFASAFSEIFSTGRLDFERFFEQIGNLAGDVLGEVLAKKLMNALRANVDTGGLGNMFSGAAGSFALAGVIGANIAGAYNAGYAAAGAAVGAIIGGFIGGMVTGGVFTAAGAKWGAAIGSWIGSMIKHGSPEFFAALTTAGEGELGFGPSGLGGGLQTIARAFGDQLNEALQRILDQIGGELEALGEGIDLKLKDDKLSVFVDGLEYRFKEDIESGISFALVEALKRADISGASDTFVKILENTTAQSLDQLADALDFGKWYDRLRLGDAAADAEEKIQAFFTAIRRATEFGLDTAPILASFPGEIERFRNSLLGIAESEEERVKRQIDSFKAWEAMTRAEMTLERAELMVERSTLAARIEHLKAHGQIDIGLITLEGELVKARGRSLESLLAMLAAMDASIAAIDTVLSGLKPITDKEAQDAINRARKAGGGGGFDQLAADLESVRDLLDEFALSQLPEFEEALARINQKWDDAAEKAKGQVDLLAEIAAAREAEVAALREQRLLDFTGSFLDFLAQLEQTGSPLLDGLADLDRRIGELGGDLGKLAEELGLTAHEMAFFWQRLLAGADELRRRLALTGLADLAGGLAQLIQDEDLRHRLLMVQAQIEFTMRMAQYAAEFEALKALGYLTAAEIALLEEAFGWVAANRDAVLKALAGGSPGGGGGGGGGGGPSRGDELLRALNRLREIQARQLDPFSQAIRSVVDEFAELRRTLGWTAEVAAVYAAEIARVVEEQLEPIRAMREGLAFDARSPLRAMDQFDEAFGRLLEAQAALAAGDLDALGDIPGLAQMVIDLMPFAGGSERARELFAMIEQLLSDAEDAAQEAAAGITPGGPNDPFAWLREQPTAGDREVVMAINRATDVLGGRLGEIDEGVGDLPRGISEVIGVRPVGGDDSGGGDQRRVMLPEEVAHNMEIQRLMRVAVSHLDTIATAASEGSGVRVRT